MEINEIISHVEALRGDFHDCVLIGSIATIVEGTTFTARGGATFLAERVRCYDEYNRTTVSVHGTYSLNGRSDRCASVALTEGSAWCKASAWDGTTFADFSEAGRKSIAVFVQEHVATTMGLLSISFADLARERAEADRVADFNRKVGQAIEALASL